MMNKLQAPIQVEIKVSITDGTRDGTATLGVALGYYPTEEDLRNRVADFERESMPQGFRLMTKREFWDLVCPPITELDEDGEPIQVRYAVPGGKEYDP